MPKHAGTRLRGPGTGTALVSSPGLDEPVAIIDIGSNSARVVVYERDAAGHLRILASSRAALRLVGEVDAKHRLGNPAIARALEALRDFRAVAWGAGARKIVGVATAAMRDAADARRFLELAEHKLGIQIEVVDGEIEGRYGFVGGVRGLPVESGLLFDMGGGSLQLARFQNRRVRAVKSLPLGALRLSQAFLKNDPPRHRQVRDLQSFVRTSIERARIAPLGKMESLVGTGGTIRNLAKIDRRGRPYPITRVHGYSLKGRHVTDIGAFLTSQGLKDRARVPGLSDERADSIVGGALALETLMGTVGAERVMVAGLGVREGIAYSLWSKTVPSVAAVQEASVASLTVRFWGARPERGTRRAGLAVALLAGLLEKPPEETRQGVSFAARLLDIGRSVDYFDRHKHAADIVLDTELDGFSHRQIGLISAIIRCARRDEESDAERYSPLLHAGDWGDVRRAGVVLALAEEIEARGLHDHPLALRCRVSEGQARVDVSGLAGWRTPQGLDSRFERIFGRQLVVRGS